MKNEVDIVEVNSENISEHGFFCVTNPKHEGYKTKMEWLKERFSEGLKIKLLYLPGEKRAGGFIEYMPGEHTWRVVDADGYMVIHCIFIEKRKNKGKGYGSMLIKECIEDAENEGMKGVAVVTSEGTWMAGKDLFLKHGFEVVDEAPPYFNLLVKKFGESESPKFRKDWEKRLNKYGSGLSIIYSHQCPFTAKFMKDIREAMEKFNIKARVIELQDSKEAQNAPCAYGVFNMVYNGKLVADHPISKTRFLNIVNKELK